MNQILQTNLKSKNFQTNSSAENNSTNKVKTPKNKITIKNKFKLLFIFSIICIISSISIFSYNHIKISKNEKISKNLSDNYTILQLYSNKDPFDIPIGETENTIIRQYRNSSYKLILPIFLKFRQRISLYFSLQISW